MDTEKQSSFVYGLVGVLVAVIVFAGGYYLCSSQKATPAEVPAAGEQESEEVPMQAPEGVVFYYGDECPHCHDVIDFFEENDVASVVDFDQKETWHDEENAAELVERAEICGYAKNQIGVPFLYADGECYIGTPDVIGYFSEQAGITSTETEEADEE
jgi:glutaredoxin